jgi:polyferredoxin
MINKIKKIQALRRIVQIISFILLPGLYSLLLGEIKGIYTSLIKGSFNINQLVSGSLALLAVIIITVLLGRFFCGWGCGFGAYNDLIYVISKKLFKTKFKINKKLDSVLKYLKYIVLTVLVIFGWTLGSNIFQGTSPWDAFAQVTDFPGVITNYIIGVLLLELITVGAFFVERFFCRYMCPLGAVFSIFSRLSIFKIEMPKESCHNCRACTNKCSMGIALFQVNEVRGGECINCLQCIEACPGKNADASLINKNIKPVMAGSAAICALAGVYLLNNAGTTALAISNFPASGDTSLTGAVANAQQKYKDGTYTGTGTGFRGGVTEIAVTILRNKITNIETVSSQDTPRFYSRVEGTMFDQIQSTQSTVVDTVSGATFSCDGIIEAVQDALNQAEANSVVSTAQSNLERKNITI